MKNLTGLYKYQRDHTRGGARGRASRALTWDARRHLFRAVKSDGVVRIHAAPGGACANYGTLCGLSTDDDEEVGREVDLPLGARIDCDLCIATIRAAKFYYESDLAK